MTAQEDTLDSPAIITPHSEIHQRLARLRERLAAEGLDGAIFNYAIDVFYFTGSRQNSVLWVPVTGEPVLLVKKSLIRAHQESAVRDVRPFPSSRDLPIVLGQSIKTIGLTFDVLPVQHFNFYQGLLSNCEFRDISAVNRGLRSVKSEWELTQMSMSGRMLAQAFSRIPEFLKPGIREVDLAAELEYILKKLGIGGHFRMRGFNQEITGIAVSGANAAVSGCFDGPVTGRGLWTASPYGPSADPVRQNVPVLIDYGGAYNGYFVDMTRIFCIGRLEPELEDAFKVSLSIQDRIRDRLMPGQICEDLFFEASRMASASDLDEHFMGHPEEPAKFVGHGVGLELDEMPILAPKFRTPLQAGHTIAVEPKFLFPGRGAVGIENTFVITEKGCKKITGLPDEIVYL